MTHTRRGFIGRIAALFAAPVIAKLPEAQMSYMGVDVHLVEPLTEMAEALERIPKPGEGRACVETEAGRLAREFPYRYLRLTDHGPMPCQRWSALEVSHDGLEWKMGNLPDGHRCTARNGLEFRRINEGVRACPSQHIEAYVQDGPNGPVISFR